MLNRRAAIIALFSVPMAQFSLANTVTTKPGKAHLTIDLDSWSGVTVKHGDDAIVLTAKEIFDALRG
jgi:hypothetical protein